MDWCPSLFLVRVARLELTATSCGARNGHVSLSLDPFRPLRLCLARCIRHRRRSQAKPDPGVKRPPILIICTKQRGTSTDADHLDIYGTHEAYLESFAHFTSLIVDGGVLFVKKGIQLEPRVSDKVTIYSYSGTEKADFYADNIRLGGGRLVFDFVTPEERVNDVELGVPVMINVENAVAAMAVAYLNGVTPDELRASMASFAGIRRRFDFHLKTDELVVIDD